MRHFLRTYGRLLGGLAGEGAGLALLIAFVVLLATMPPLDVQRSTDSLLGYDFQVNTKTWLHNLSTYANALKSGEAFVDRQNSPAGPLVAKRLGASLLLMGAATGVAIGLGAAKGFWDFHAMRRRKLALGPVISSAIAGLPDFWLVMLLQMGAAFLYREFDFNPFRTSYDAQDPVSSLVFPLFTLSLIPLAHVARLTATAMNTVYDRDYIRTARSKGLPEMVVVYKHALRNALVQILDAMPGVIAIMMSNLLIVEYLFNYPGLTTLLLDAIAGHATVRGTAALSAAVTQPEVGILVPAGVALGLIFSVLYLAIRILRRVADPRLKGRDAA
jgi:ABC-type dipeptide/oligopeptide/nickel transport system permease component